MRAKVVRRAVLGAVAVVGLGLPGGAGPVVDAGSAPEAASCIDLDQSMWLLVGAAPPAGHRMELYLLSCATDQGARDCLRETRRRAELELTGSVPLEHWEAYWWHMGELVPPVPPQPCLP